MMQTQKLHCRNYPEIEFPCGLQRTFPLPNYCGNLAESSSVQAKLAVLLSRRFALSEAAKT
jgi:hypothetical protein